MPAVGTVFTQSVAFGVSNGPTYSGQNIVPITVTGTETYRNYSSQVLNSAVADVMDAIGFVQANWLAMGFCMVLDAVQSGAPTPAQLLAATVTIHLKNVDGGAADVDIVLGVGQAVAFEALAGVPGAVPPALVDMDSDATGIEVDGDANCDCCVYGLLLLSS